MADHGSSVNVGAWNINGIYSHRVRNPKTDIERQQHLRKIRQIHDLPATPNITNYLNKLKLDILGIAETKLKPNAHHDTNNEISIPNFTKERYDREGDQQGGGLLAYFRKNTVGDPSILKTDTTDFGLQYLSVEVIKPLNFVLVIVYHPGGMSKLPALLKFLLDFMKRPIVLIGDFNITPQQKCRKKLNELKKKYGKLHWLLEEGTTYYRGHKSSLLDNIFTNIPRCQGNEGNLCISEGHIETGKSIKIPDRVSDHDLIWCTISQHDANKIQQPVEGKSLLQYPIDAQTNQPVEVEAWIKKHMQIGISVLAAICQFLKAPDVSTFEKTESVEVYKTENCTDAIVTTKFEAKQDALNIQHVLKEFKDMLRFFQPKPLLRRCILLSVPNESLSDVITADNKLCPSVEHFAKRFSFCDEDECFSVFKTEKVRIIHQESEHGLEPVKCGFKYEDRPCDQVFDTEQAHLQHVCKYHDNNPFIQCRLGYCNEAFHQDDEKKHTLDAHKLHICDYEGRKCRGFKFIHEQGAHRCPKCGKNKNKSFDSERKLWGHLVKDHNTPQKLGSLEKFYEVYRYEQSTSERKETSSKEKQLECKTCGEMHTYSTQCRGQNYFRCSKCERQFVNEEFFNDHTAWCGSKEIFCCSTCKKEYVNETCYDKHIAWCGGEKPYCCPKCKKGYVYEKSYNNHIAWCGGLKPFSCQKCKKGYVYKKSYNNHIACCSGKKPHMCPFCGKGYKNKKSCYKNHVKRCSKK